MKICTFCGSDNENAATQCRECCTEEFRYPTLEELSGPASPESAEPSPEWEWWTELSVDDAKDFLQGLDEADIRFQLDHEPSAHSAATATHGGNFGRGGLIRIFTRTADRANVEKVWKRFCNFSD